MKTYSTTGLALALVILPGCSKKDVQPRFQGAFVSHVDTYGSGTGSETKLTREGSLVGGFDYGDPTKADWTSNITWSFLHHDGGSDVYRIEWTFRPKTGTGGTKTKEISFDGTRSVRVFANQWQTISIEPPEGYSHLWVEGSPNAEER